MIGISQEAQAGKVSIGLFGSVSFNGVEHVEVVLELIAFNLGNAAANGLLSISGRSAQIPEHQPIWIVSIHSEWQFHPDRCKLVVDAPAPSTIKHFRS